MKGIKMYMKTIKDTAMEKRIKASKKTTIKIIDLNDKTI